ncbi:DUF2637 domain-containing protein [Mycolicibacterium septicum]|uniref:DUF2637 domain-containing protein n=1 Tax=Mycolicibacterium septicum TaxID=98668 RepID=A0ABW9LNT5_9MYCO
MTSTEKTSDTLREVRSILWTLLIAATVASVAGNVARTVIVHGLHWSTVGPVVLALLGPVALLGLFHLMAAWSRAAEAGSAMFWFFLLAVIGLAAAAFRLSFAALRDLAQGYGYSYVDAALFPLILDGVIAVCTVGLVAATRPRRKAKRTVRPTPPQRVRGWWRGTPDDAEQPVQTTANRDAEQVDAPTLRDVHGAAPAPTATQTASVRDAELATHTATHANANRDATPEEPVTQPDARRDADTEEIPVTCSDSHDAPAKHGGEAPTTRRLTAVPTPRPAAAHTPASPATQTRTDRDAEADDEFMLRATQLVEAGRTKAPVDAVHRVLRGKSAGETNRDLASETGLTESAVQRIWTAARELDATSEEPEPAFA